MDKSFIGLNLEPFLLRHLAFDQFSHDFEREGVALQVGVWMPGADVLYGTAQN